MFISYKIAEKEAKKLFPTISLEPDFVELLDQNNPIPITEYESYWSLMKEVEKNPMNYFVYTERIWEEFVHGKKDNYPKVFKKFQDQIIQAHLDMAVRHLIYHDIQKNMNLLVETLLPKVKSLILWTKGDVDHTGYQVRKVELSGIISDVKQACIDVFGKQKGMKLFSEKTKYFVLGNKVQGLSDYLTHLRKSQKYLSLSIIEDSLSNIYKVDEITKEIFGSNVKLTPIFASYSAYGKAMEVNNQNEYKRVMKEYNGVNSFTEILKPSLVTDISESYFLVDFDGVILDNIERRKLQGNVKHSAILWANKHIKAGTKF